jgi:hypothetical protein
MCGISLTLKGDFVGETDGSSTIDPTESVSAQWVSQW